MPLNPRVQPLIVSERLQVKMSKRPGPLCDFRECQREDYSKWEKSKRPNGLKSIKPKAVHWSSAAPDQKEPKSSHRPTRGLNGHMAAPNELIQVQPGKSGRYRQNPTEKSPTASSRLSRRIKPDKRDQESISRRDKTQTLKLLIKLQKMSVEDLEKHCEVLQETNQQVVRDIEDTDRHSFFSARESLILHEKLGSSIVALKRWSDRQTRQAKADLEDSVREAENRLSGLQAQLKTVEIGLADAEAKLYHLQTYRDQEYPLKALQIAELKREVKKLKDAQQDEYEEVKLMCQTEMARLERQLHQNQNEVMRATAKEKMSEIPPAVTLMVLHNRSLKKEVDVYKKEIMQLEDKNRKLLKCIQKLQLSRPNTSNKVFQDIFPKSEKCSPDMDVYLNIPREEWLPI